MRIAMVGRPLRSTILALEPGIVFTEDVPAAEVAATATARPSPPRASTRCAR